jgi:hypothetical protein
MTRRSLAVGSTLVLSSVTSIGILAQSPEPGSPEAEFAKCVRTQCIVSGEIVTGAPFSAEATTEWRPTDGRTAPISATSHYYRDSEGHLRVEWGLAGETRPRRIFLIPDINERGSYMVDPVAGTVTPGFPRSFIDLMIGGGGWNFFVVPLSANRFWAFLQTPIEDPEALGAAGEEALGSKFIEGVPTIGKRFSTRLPLGVTGVGVAERWVSPDLKVVIYSRSEDAAIGVVEYTLTNIDRTEPTADLFEVPKDYNVTPFRGAHPGRWIWQNPYSPQLPGR